jgi:hypothetical protein
LLNKEIFDFHGNWFFFFNIIIRMIENATGTGDGLNGQYNLPGQSHVANKKSMTIPKG